MSVTQQTYESRSDRLPAVLTRSVWAGFLVSLLLVGVFVLRGEGWRFGTLARVDGLTLVMWVAVTFFSGVVHSFSRRYLAANPRRSRFFLGLSSLTVAVGVMTAANHVALFVLAWATMGWLMGGLIGHVEGWNAARRAGRLSRIYFLSGSAVLGLALFVLAGATGEPTITGLLGNLDALTPAGHTLATALLLTAAMIQSALFPFHRWLLSSMTAPTPASAMMHAGFVNAGGVLLARFAPVFAGSEGLMLAVAVAGAASALFAQVWMVVQPDVKSRLGCSTVAQMGFMILQCGLGFFAAAVTHLIVHGFYKAYLFLASSSRVEKHPPGESHGTGEDLPLAVRGGVTLLTALAGGALFAFITGKALTAPETGLFLTVVVVLAVLHGTRDLLGRPGLSPTIRVLGVPAVLLPAMALYGAAYNAVSALTYGLPAIHVPMALSAGHWLLLACFVAAHVGMELGLHRRSKGLYVTAMNVAQPAASTVLTSKEDYHDH